MNELFNKETRNTLLVTLDSMNSYVMDIGVYSIKNFKWIGSANIFCYKLAINNKKENPLDIRIYPGKPNVFKCMNGEDLLEEDLKVIIEKFTVSLYELHSSLWKSEKPKRPKTIYNESDIHYSRRVIYDLIK